MEEYIKKKIKELEEKIALSNKMIEENNMEIEVERRAIVKVQHDLAIYRDILAQKNK